MRMSQFRFLSVVFFVMPWFVAAASAQLVDEESAIQSYKKQIVRKPFFYHTRARMALARSRELKPLEILMKDYAKPRAYDEWARYTIGTMLDRFYASGLWEDQFKALRAKWDGPGDMWTWVTTLAVEDRPGAATDVVKMIRESKSLLHKAAAITALGRRERREVLEVIPEVVAAFPKKKKYAERRLLVGALSTAIFANKPHIKEPDMQKAIRAYIGLLHEDVELTHSAKMVIARFLAKTIGKDRRYIQPEPWIQLLDQGFEPPKRTAHTVSQLRFFGVEAEGDRICYLVDMSNSMLKKIDPGLLKKGPITGKKRKRKKGQMPDESDIPWHIVKTRFDLAREHLKISMQRLTKDKRFCVVWFGDQSGLLKSTPGMIKATRGNVKKVMKELDSIKADMTLPKGRDRRDYPDGILKGQTNLHGGLRRAFALQAKGFAKRHEYVDLKALAQGCDTIFLLSDGAPTSDDFRMLDKDYGDGEIVYEREQKRKAPRVDNIWYTGPMDQPHWVKWDIERMNIFRHVQIHCVGIGEADVGLLRGIAETTDGNAFFLGAKAKKAAGKTK